MISWMTGGHDKVSNINWLFPEPKGCVFCSRPASGTGSAWKDLGRVTICFECREEIGWIGEPYCEHCGRQLAEQTSDEKVMRHCRDCVNFRNNDGTGMIMKNRAVVQYTPLARHIIGLFKYRGRETLAEPCGKLMADVVRREYRNESISAVTYVPLHMNRERERGFNQAERLARVIGKQLRRPVHQLLCRTKDTPKQSKQIRHERIASMSDAFRIRFPEKRNFYCQGTFLIVDDVYTTGATLRACAQQLVNAGVPRILAVTFAR